MSWGSSGPIQPGLSRLEVAGPAILAHRSSAGTRTMQAFRDGGSTSWGAQSMPMKARMVLQLSADTSRRSQRAPLGISRRRPSLAPTHRRSVARSSGRLTKRGHRPYGPGQVRLVPAGEHRQAGAFGARAKNGCETAGRHSGSPALMSPSRKSSRSSALSSRRPSSRRPSRRKVSVEKSGRNRKTAVTSACASTHLPCCA
jgi:hypothetical protein